MPAPPPTPPPKGLGRFGLDSFVFLLLGVVVLAYLWPEPVLRPGTFSLDAVATVGVSLIFFFYGLRLSPDKLRAGLRNGRLHALIHLTTFGLFPLLVLGMKPLLMGTPQERLWPGLFFLAALPSTVSSSVVMVSIARGNLPAAIFNASISSLLGVFLTPLWMSLVPDSVPGGTIDVGPVVGKLVGQVLLPVGLGIALHRWGGAAAERRKNGLKRFDQAVILLIVYTSFGESFATGQFAGTSAGVLVALGAGMLALFLLVYVLINRLCRWLGFSREDRITAVFCGSKKSLVHGSVMAQVLFPGTAAVGVLLLPLLLYHALQLIAASVLAQLEARRASAPTLT
jgi:sodium/bile acid cotransporter 7